MASSEITVQVSVKDIEPIKGLIALLAFHFDQLPPALQDELRNIIQPQTVNKIEVETNGCDAEAIAREVGAQLSGAIPNA